KKVDQKSERVKLIDLHPTESNHLCELLSLLHTRNGLFVEPMMDMLVCTITTLWKGCRIKGR
nr:hypothetical protein [Tanacetum cinerariifolium]